MAATALVVARDEADAIVRCVEGIRDAVAEVLVVDTGSADDTAALAAAAGARVLHTEWRGYGPTKNWAAAQATHPWILSLDADEVPDAAALAALRTADLRDPTRAYGLRRVTQFCGSWIRHGSWRRDVVWRLYHRDRAAWDDRPVHETLAVAGARVRLPGELLHYSYPDRASLARKHAVYLPLAVDALVAEGARATWVKRHVAPAWRAFRAYVLYGGWRDGRAGRTLALADYRMVREKYRRLAARQAAKGH